MTKHHTTEEEGEDELSQSRTMDSIVNMEEAPTNSAQTKKEQDEQQNNLMEVMEKQFKIEKEIQKKERKE